MTTGIGGTVSRTTSFPQAAKEMSPRHPELADCIQRKALRFGDFQLSSGRRSDYYLDGKMISFDPEGISLVVEALLQELERVSFSAVGGMDMGATPIVAGLALRSEQLKRPIPTFTVRKDKKAHGTQKQIEGPLPPAPCDVVVVDDVVTSGGSIVQAIEAVEARGYRVVLAISVVDRNAGGREALRKRRIPYRPLVSLSDLGIADVTDCRESEVRSA